MKFKIIVAQFLHSIAFDIFSDCDCVYEPENETRPNGSEATNNLFIFVYCKYIIFLIKKVLKYLQSTTIFCERHRLGGKKNHSVKWHDDELMCFHFVDLFYIL